MSTRTKFIYSRKGLALILTQLGVAYSQKDLVEGCKYLNGNRNCAEYDALSNYEKSIVDLAVKYNSLDPSSPSGIVEL